MDELPRGLRLVSSERERWTVERTAFVFSRWIARIAGPAFMLAMLPVACFVSVHVAGLALVLTGVAALILTSVDAAVHSATGIVTRSWRRIELGPPPDVGYRASAGRLFVMDGRALPLRSLVSLRLESAKVRPWVPRHHRVTLQWPDEVIVLTSGLELPPLERFADPWLAVRGLGVPRERGNTPCPRRGLRPRCG